MLEAVGQVDARLQPEHLISVLGVPVAAVGSLFIVLVCEVRSRGPMKIQVLGFKFEGASSQVILWVICFLAFTLAIKLLWYR